ncbi:MAG: hypothetical protein ABIG30_01570 [Candidatus Aenigmatarchaeota archaeon]
MQAYARAQSTLEDVFWPAERSCIVVIKDPSCMFYHGKCTIYRKNGATVYVSLCPGASRFPHACPKLRTFRNAGVNVEISGRPS